MIFINSLVNGHRQCHDIQWYFDNGKRKLNDFLPLWTLVSHFQSISPSVDGHKKHCGFLQF